METNNQGTPDLGDLVIVLLAGTLAGLRDRLAQDGFPRASELVARLVEEADGYIDSIESATSERGDARPEQGT
jgi:hypothetical protein